jgi:hypothetical protein
MRASRRLAGCGLAPALLALVGSCALALRAGAQTVDPRPEQPTERPAGVRLGFDDRPVLEIGDAARLEFGVRLQADVRTDDTSVLDAGTFDWGARRVEVEGRVSRRVEFEVSYEIGHERPWRDAYVDVRATRALSTQAGRFKVPFGYERLRGGGRLDYVNRSYAADRLTPGRQGGAAAHGRLGRRLEYQAGVFSAGLPESVAADPAARHAPREPLVAGRLVAQPFRARGNDRRLLRSVELGVAGLRGRNAPMLTTLGVRTLDARERVFPAVYVNGPRAGIGAEARWSPGRLRLDSEWIRVRELRIAQALDGRDLPPLVASGWYVSGIYQVVGGRRSDAHWLTAALLRDVEVGARLEGIGFRAGGDPTPAAVVHPRADVVPPHGLRALTLGASWRLTRFGRIQGNVVAEQPDVPATSGLDAARRWSSVVRLQLRF